MITLRFSAGSLYNFNEDAFNRLEEFERIAKQKLISFPLIHADETGMNVNGKRIWLHNASGLKTMVLEQHQKQKEFLLLDQQYLKTVRRCQALLYPLKQQDLKTQ